MSKTLAMILSCLMAAAGCARLPTKSRDDTLAPQINNAAMTGLVIHSSDSNYTATALYFYDLSAGKLSLLAGGESGDLLSPWLQGRLFLFNRASGRVSYSSLLPRAGVQSRSVEQATPEAQAFDPTDVIEGPDGSLILSMNMAAKVTIVNPQTNTLIASLGDVDTGIAGQVFRPSEMEFRADGKTLWVTHQALDAKYDATGAGRIYTADSKNGIWEWRGRTGVSLTITNPVYMDQQSDGKILIGGTCYAYFGKKCVGGLDQFDPYAQTVNHLSAWDESLWSSNGGFTKDLFSESLLACMTQRTTGKNLVVRYSIATGAINVLHEVTGFGCGGLVVDRVGQRIFVGKTLTKNTGAIAILDRDGIEQTSVAVDSSVTGLIATYD